MKKERRGRERNQTELIFMRRVTLRRCMHYFYCRVQFISLSTFTVLNVPQNERVIIATSAGCALGKGEAETE